MKKHSTTLRRHSVDASPDVFAEATSVLSAYSQAGSSKPRLLKKYYQLLADIDSLPNDDDPIVVKRRLREDDRSAKFQKYQFILFPSGSRTSKGNSRGLSTAMWSTLQERAEKMSKERVGMALRAEAAELQEQAITGMRNSMTETSVGAVADAMPGKFSTGVLTADFDSTNPPKNPTAETAWIFDDDRFRYFIVRRISAEALAAYRKDPDNMTGLPRLFGSAIKAYVNLYNFFRIGQSDQGFLDDPDLGHVRLWYTVEARKAHRKRLCQEGFELFGRPSEGKAVPPDYDYEHVRLVWPIFMRVFRSL